MEANRSPMRTQRRPRPGRQAIRTPATDAWLFRLSQLESTPSRADGIDKELERRLMVACVKYIGDCAQLLQIPQLTVGVAATFFQQFYMLESMVRHKPHEVAASCLFLACKVNETHRKLKDVIFHTVKARTGGALGDDVVEGTDRYKEEKITLLYKERDLLRSLNFRLSVDPPFAYINELCKAYCGSHPEAKSVLQLSFNFVNDSYRTYVHIMFDSREIAVAVLLLGAYAAKFPMSTFDDSSDKDMPTLIDYFGCDEERIYQIIDLLIDSYDHGHDRPSSEAPSAQTNGG